MNVVTKKDRRLKEQFINDISDKEMMKEVIRELTAIKEAKKMITGG